MLNSLNQVDHSLFSWLNSFHSAFFDSFMWMVSGKLTWLGFYLVIVMMLFFKNWKQALLVLILTGIVIALADQISASLIKPFVQRLRPSHTESLSDTIHIIRDYRGGMYGFVSNHAANVFGLATFLSLVWKRRVFTLTLFVWATVVSYSRIYLGVHFPGDILCGGIIGALVGLFIYVGYFYLSHLTILQPRIKYAFKNNSALMVCFAFVLTLIVFGGISYNML